MNQEDKAFIEAIRAVRVELVKHMCEKKLVSAALAHELLVSRNMTIFYNVLRIEVALARDKSCPPIRPYFRNLYKGLLDHDSTAQLLAIARALMYAAGEISDEEYKADPTTVV